MDKKWREEFIRLAFNLGAGLTTDTISKGTKAILKAAEAYKNEAIEEARKEENIIDINEFYAEAGDIQLSKEYDTWDYDNKPDYSLEPWEDEIAVLEKLGFKDFKGDWDDGWVSLIAIIKD